MGTSLKKEIPSFRIFQSPTSSSKTARWEKILRCHIGAERLVDYMQSVCVNKNFNCKIWKGSFEPQSISDADLRSDFEKADEAFKRLSFIEMETLYQEGCFKVRMELDEILEKMSEDQINMFEKPMRPLKKGTSIVKFLTTPQCFTSAHGSICALFNETNSMTKSIRDCRAFLIKIFKNERSTVIHQPKDPALAFRVIFLVYRIFIGFDIDIQFLFVGKNEDQKNILKSYFTDVIKFFDHKVTKEAQTKFHWNKRKDELEAALKLCKA